ncbi:NAD-dependent epimerase/dehydratase family protein [Gimesia maris]|uniref:NAD-dependent epimerase/dehydratase family protein n=1 Tax=Gimesia maris TaxID=122 RepID=UPI003A925B14
MTLSSLGVTRLRVAIVGCGAVSERYHLPVLAGHEGVELVALVDRDLKRARDLAVAYGVDQVYADASELSAEIADAAVIATPPFHHAICGTELLNKGLHILVEKPIATTFDEAEKMVQLAQSKNLVISVSVFRRLLPSLRMMKAALNAEMLGKPTGFRVEGGGVYGWEAATLGNMLKEQSGGGVLADLGPHVIDQLLYLFGGPASVAEYRDNARGGIESDCVATLNLDWRGSRVQGQIELTRTRNLQNEFCVQCREGDLVILPSDRYRVLVRRNDLSLNDPRTGNPHPHQMFLSWEDEPETEWLETFRAGIDDWIGAIETTKQPELSGASVLGVTRLVEECYQSARPLAEPWSEHPLKTAEIRTKVQDRRRILVTGASGFIGSRIAEILSQRSGYLVRAAVHNPSNASRIARFDVELRQADLTDREQVRGLTEGVDAVVHCAIGTQSWDPSSVFNVTVGGTKNLLACSESAGCKHFVHLSTIAVHPDDFRGIINEKTPVTSANEETYGASKLQAERAVLASGLRTTVFRPGCVYGPFGKTFITRPIERMMEGALVLAGSAETNSNTLYVDNLVEAVVRALETKAELSSGIFSLSDDDGNTWGEFYGYFAEKAGVELCVTDRVGASVGTRSGPSWIRSLREIATSSEAQSLAAKALWTDPVGKPPRWVLSKAPGLKQRMKHMLGMNSAAVYQRPSAATDDIVEITPRYAEVKSDAAREKLGWQPLLSREECLDRTYQWLVSAAILPSNEAVTAR